MFADNPSEGSSGSTGSGSGRIEASDASEAKAWLLHKADGKAASEIDAQTDEPSSTGYLLDRVAALGNLSRALLNVARNKGAAGVDGCSVEEAMGSLPRELVDHNQQLQLPAVFGPFTDKVVAPHVVPMRGLVTHTTVVASARTLDSLAFMLLPGDLHMFLLPGQSVQVMLDAIDTQLKGIDMDLDKLIRASPTWQAKVDLLKRVPGVGDQTARSLIAQLPELSTCSRQQIAALVGVAPMNRDSGLMRGRCTTCGGRANVRRALYMATLVATRYNPTIRCYYQRLVEAGKKKKIALVASMRKLLVILNAILRDQKIWKNTPVNA